MLARLPQDSIFRDIRDDRGDDREGLFMRIEASSFKASSRGSKPSAEEAFSLARRVNYEQCERTMWNTLRRILVD